MELKDFIKTTLVAVIQGVQEAQDAISDTDARINTRAASTQIRTVDFDVAVTAREEADVTAGVGISVVGIIKGGTEGAYGRENTAVSRVRFGVPVRLPIHSSGE